MSTSISSSNPSTNFPAPGQFVSRSRVVVSIERRDISQPISKSMEALNFEQIPSITDCFPTYPQKPVIIAPQSLNFDLERSESNETGCGSPGLMSSQDNVSTLSDIKLVSTLLMDKEKEPVKSSTCNNNKVDSIIEIPESPKYTFKPKKQPQTQPQDLSSLLPMTHDYFSKKSWQQKSNTLIKRNLNALNVKIDQAQTYIQMRSLTELLGPQMENTILFQDSFQSKAGHFMEVCRR